MKILYRQPDAVIENYFTKFGINTCYLKQIEVKSDSKLITRKEHHHTGFEIHIIKNGYQIYKIGNEKLKIREGQFLLIPPCVKHTVVKSSEKIQKYAITFAATVAFPTYDSFTFATVKAVPQNFEENINYIETLKNDHPPFFDILTENRIFETVISLLSACGLKQKELPDLQPETDLRLTLAKQFIKDNIHYSLTVTDVARYCYLSEKQLTRLFLQHENITTQKYILHKKIKQIQKLLEDKTLTLKEISEKMGFNNEYYFSTFFKKHCGMPPGTYRKMNG